MKEIKTTTKYKKDFKRIERQGKKMSLLKDVLTRLVNDEPLDRRHHNHKLSGEYSDCWECHIQPDWLLIYRCDETTITLVRMGSHPELYK